MNTEEIPLFIFFLLVVRHVCILTFIRPLQGVLGKSGVLIFSLTLSLWLYPVSILSQEEFLTPSLITLVLREVVIGCMIGLPCALIFEIIPFVGRLIDTFRGVQFAEQLAPEMGPRDSLLESYGGFIAVWIFFEGIYVEEWIKLLLKADNALSFVNASGTSLISGIMISRSALIEFIGDFLSICLIIVLPLILLSFTLELSLSLLQKLSAKFHIGFELSMIRAGMGVFFLFFIVISGMQAPLQIHALSEKGFKAISVIIGVQ